MSNKNDTEQITQIWSEFERGKDYFDKLNLVNEITKAHRFYEGDQWHGTKTGGEELPIIDIIAPIVDYKTSVVTLNQWEIIYSPTNYDDPAFQAIGDDICKMLNDHAARVWEDEYMDDVISEAVEDAAICRAAYLYFYYAPGKTHKENGKDIEEPGKIECEKLDPSQIMFADEQERKLQKQPYILIPRRQRLADVRKEAESNRKKKKNNLKPGDIKNIVSDDDTETIPGDRAQFEVEQSGGDAGKCRTVLKLYKKDGEIWMSKSTRSVVYMEPQKTGLKCYPVAGYVWSRVKGSCRGQGVVNKWIPNQIGINKMAAYRFLSAKMNAFAKPVVDVDVVSNGMEAVTSFGTAIEVHGMGVSNVKQAVGYLQPADMSTDAKSVQEELITHTKDNAGASDVARGQTDMDTYSAILAIREMSEAPINSKQTSASKKFMEDIARIWYDMWANAYPDGLPVVQSGPLNTEDAPETDEEPRESPKMVEQQYVIKKEILDKLKPRVKVDISPSSPLNKLVEQQKADNLLSGDKISFDEYVDMLPDTEPIKAKLERVIEARGQLAQITEILKRLQEDNVAYAQENEALKSELQKAGAVIGRGAQLNTENKNKYYEQGQIDAIAKIQGGAENGRENTV